MSLEEAKKKKKNKKRNRFIFRTAILAVLIGAIVFALISNIQADNSVYQIGDDAPDFKLKQINKNNKEEMIQLSDFEGKGVMLNFWGTWCKPCEEEMPYMQALYPKYKDKGIEIIAVSLDNTELAVDSFIDKYDLTFPIPHDKTGEVMDIYKVGPIPSSFFINPDGKIERIINGALTLEKLDGYLQEILPQK
nr:thiol-disulfide oxidoreductase ResA [Priestia megaterium]